ncbi:hypothetical protein EBB54_28415 [Schaedlerella arabinosiphila]|uniref:Uncharacterized protein n=1 Tax=Schaedlerella arabinosiphila TaxID=2044587 RepID=A0A3R8JSV7_9FIRM|nr:hypothetical protein EBB54_28415 [Schaedlerella arabinosiphila]
MDSKWPEGTDQIRSGMAGTDTNDKTRLPHPAKCGGLFLSRNIRSNLSHSQNFIKFYIKFLFYFLF